MTGELLKPFFPPDIESVLAGPFRPARGQSEARVKLEAVPERRGY